MSLFFHRIIRSTEVHGLVDKGFTTGTGTNGLVIDLRTASLGQVSEPTLVDLGRERRTRAIEPFSGRSRHAGSEDQNGGEEESLLSETSHNQKEEDCCN